MKKQAAAAGPRFPYSSMPKRPTKIARPRPMCVESFSTEKEAIACMQEIEPTTPRLSLGGASPSPTPTYEEQGLCTTENEQRPMCSLSRSGAMPRSS
jgi:hypothetical protein